MLEREIKEKQESEEAAAAMARQAAVDRETRLNKEERDLYGGFLKKDYFIKSDFGALDKFYAHSWDRLSDDGKSQMSHRVWEGIRRQEFSLDELPQSVKEKESSWAYDEIGKGDSAVTTVSAIPQKDRDDFKRAYESGDKNASIKILARQGFTDHLATGVSRENVGTEKEQGQGKSDRRTPVSSEKSSAESKKSMANIDLTGVDLSNLQLKDSPEKVSSVDIPRNGQTVQTAFASR